MPELQIYYVVGYGLAKPSGRNKATLEKAAALTAVAGGAVRLVFPASFRSKLASYCSQMLFDLRVLPTLLFAHGNTVVIERQAFLPLTNTWLWIRGIPIICEVHADPAGEIPFLQKNPVEKWLLRILARYERHNWRLAAGMLYVNPLFQQLMAHRVRKPSLSVYNGCDPQTFVVKDQAACRRRLGLPAGVPCFLMIGAMSVWRGVDQLIDVFRQPSLRGHMLLLVGLTGTRADAALRGQAQGLANVQFRDYTDIITSVDYIGAADVCLLPVNDVLSAPGSPLKLYDYIACGKPVITQSGVMGYSDEVLRYSLGAVTDFRNPAAAAADLLGFINRADLETYRLHNREVAEQQVSWKKRMEEWMVFIRSVAHPPRRTGFTS